jgi:hypothetical protein
MDSLTVYRPDLGSINAPPTLVRVESQPVTGRYLAHNRLDRVGKAFLASDLISGDKQLVKPTLVQAAMLAGVNATYAWWAGKQQANRLDIEAGYLPLVPRRVKAPISDPEIIASCAPLASRVCSMPRSRLKRLSKPTTGVGGAVAGAFLLHERRNFVVKPQTPTNLRHWEQRAAALKVADSILRADRRRQRRMAINNEGGGTAPTPTSNKKREDSSPFAVLRTHPAYRAPRHGAHRP